MRRPEIIQKIRKVLQVAAPGAQTILYDSEAWGDARPDSDIDLLILVDEPQLTPEHRTTLIQYRFERAYQTLEEVDYASRQ